ncbi:MAG: cytochrome c oxidase accessory protein CcoG [Burkholderiales bacterium]|nr:cytochrome c oxidase accessory protein CcoG [Burkholderiales bacterium]
MGRKTVSESTAAIGSDHVRGGRILVIEPWTKIHAREVHGRHANWRWALVWITQLVFYGLPWLAWDGRPALLIDLEARRFFLFGAVLMPHDLIWLTTLLVLCALLLFLATALAGRIWCGFACPQTVYTAIYSWIEARFEGDRLARQRLDASPWSVDKLKRRGAKHLAWCAVGVWTGITLVGYFTPMPQLLHEVATMSLGPWEAFWILFYALATYGNAGFLREKVCQHMCPYGRFQGSMLDPRTLNVSYDARRGEPRGGRSRSADAKALGLGSCVDCTVCVQVCPMGIDIRNGLQAACINCGLCIDACDRVMDKLGQARGLIRFASEQELGQLSRGGVPLPPLWLQLLRQFRRPRVGVYSALLLITIGLLVGGLASRPTLRLDAMRDRSLLARLTADGEVENVYRLLVANASGREREVTLSVEAGIGAAIDGLTLHGPQVLRLRAGEARPVVISLRAPESSWASLGGKVLPVRIVAMEAASRGRSAETTAANSTFFVPR